MALCSMSINEPHCVGSGRRLASVMPSAWITLEELKNYRNPCTITHFSGDKPESRMITGWLGDRSGVRGRRLFGDVLRRRQR